LSVLKRQVAEVFAPLLPPARYKGAYGGRGSGKSHFFGEQLVEDCLAEPGLSGQGLLAVCIREVQNTLAQSSKRLIEDKIAALGVGGRFRIYTDKIQTPGDGLIIFQGMQDHTAESIKSLEGFKRAWIEEAQSLSHRSLTLLRPTIRAEGSEIWASWNARRKSDAIDEFLRGKQPAGAVVVKANWRDNPFFPAVLEDERRLDLALYPDRYDIANQLGAANDLNSANLGAYNAMTGAAGTLGNLSEDQANRLLSAGSQLSGDAQNQASLIGSAANNLNSGLLSAAGLAPQLASSDYTDLQNLLNVGGAYDSYNQNVLNSQLAAWQYAQQQPWNILQAYSGAITGLGSLGGTSSGVTTQQQPQQSLLPSLIGAGGAVLGSPMTSIFGTALSKI
jgi:phage terminase large subunit